MTAAVRSPRRPSDEANRCGGRHPKWEQSHFFCFSRGQEQGNQMMNGADLLRIVDVMHREKNIPKDVIFGGIEAAVQLAMQKQYGEESGIVVTIDRETGDIKARKGEEVIDPTVLGRI